MDQSSRAHEVGARKVEPQGVKQQHENGCNAKRQKANHPGQGAEVTHGANVDQTPGSALKELGEFARDEGGEGTWHHTLHFLRWAHLHGQGFTGDGVAVVQLSARQMQPRARVDGGCAVHGVAHNGVSHGRGVASYLVCPSCLYGPFHQGCLPVNGPVSDAEHPELRAAGFAINGETTLAGIGKLISADPAVVGLGDERPLRLEGLKDFRVPSHKDGATGPVIQTVERFGAFGQLSAASQQCTEVVPPASVGRQPSRLEHDRMVLVTMQYVQLLIQRSARC